MEWVETTGKSIEDALEAALDQLGVDESDAEFEVLSEPRWGLLSRFRAEARVRARVRPTQPRPKDQQQGGRRRKSAERQRPDSTEGPDSTETDSSTEVSRPDRARATKAQPAQTRSRPQKSPVPSTEGASPMEEPVAFAEQGDVAKTFLSGLFAALAIPVSIDLEIDESDEIISVDVNGDQLGHLIGPRGSTLQSIQELTRTVVQRRTGARSGRIIVDLARYRQKRKVALERFTREVAEEVLSSGTERVLESMNSADRKVVHDTANQIDGVITTSEGEDPRRWVVIKPAGV